MKTSLSYLPEIKQTQILHIVEIIKAVVNPEKIILYGSYAKNSYVEHRYRDSSGTEYEYRSDYDILVVTKNNPHNTNEIDGLISSKIPNHYPELNLEIHEIDYINEGLAFGQYFFSDIVKEGILLYDTGNVLFAEPKELSREESKDVARNYFDIWFPKGASFLKGVRFYIEEGEFKIAAFLLHQAAESFYYATLLVFTSYKPKIHNLKKLRKQAKSLSDELFDLFPIESERTEKHLFDLLKRGYIDARYRIDYNITKDEVEQIFERVTKMKEIVLTECTKKMESI